MGQAGLALLVGGFGGEALVHHGLAGQFGVGADQGQLRLDAGGAQHTHHGVLELGQAGKGPMGQRRAGNPRRVFIQTGEQGRGINQRGVVELIQGQWSLGHGLYAV